MKRMLRLEKLRREILRMKRQQDHKKEETGNVPVDTNTVKPPEEGFGKPIAHLGQQLSTLSLEEQSISRDVNDVPPMPDIPQAAASPSAASPVASDDELDAVKSSPSTEALQPASAAHERLNFPSELSSATQSHIDDTKFKPRCVQFLLPNARKC